MKVNQNTMEKVHDVNKQSYHTPDLRYSEETERWTMDEAIQEKMGLNTTEKGLVMYIATDEDTGEQIILVEVVDREQADFFTGEGNIFTARRLADVTGDENQFAVESVENMENTYAFRTWDGESPLLNSTVTSTQGQEEEEETEDFEDDLSNFAETTEDQEGFEV